MQPFLGRAVAHSFEDSTLVEAVKQASSETEAGYSGSLSPCGTQYVRAAVRKCGTNENSGFLPDEKVVFFLTGYMGAVNYNIRPSDAVAVCGCGPVAQFAAGSCWAPAE
jgi:hypothetical protein